MRTKRILLWLTLVLVVTAAPLIAQELPDVAGGEDLFNLAVMGVTVVLSAMLGVVKKFTGILDTAVGKLIKPIQPLVVSVLGMALPFLGGKIGLITEIPTGELFASAPAATVFAVAIREIYVRLTGQKD